MSELDRASYDKKRASGKCTECGNDKEDRRVRCENCTQQQKYRDNERYAKMVAAGLCKCGKRMAQIGLRCEPCWFKHMSKHATGTSDYYSEIWIMIEKQGYKCGYTGVNLIPGVNASLDHIIPRAIWGSSDVKNLIWCDIKINYMKRDMMPQQFILACKRITLITGGNIDYYDNTDKRYRSPHQMWFDFEKNEDDN